MAEFMRPTVTTEEVNDIVARFIVEPLERGFGYTLGNCMRRVLLSSLDGAKATAIQIEGVQHRIFIARHQVGMFRHFHYGNSAFFHNFSYMRPLIPELWA